jgi:hypothetical protein
MEIDSETIPSPTSTIQRETYIIPADPVAPRGALKEAIPSCPNFSPNVQVLRVGTLQKGGSYRFSRNPRRVVWFCRNKKMTGRCLCNGFFKTYALIPC